MLLEFCPPWSFFCFPHLIITMLSLIHFYGCNIPLFANVNKFSPLKSKTRAFGLFASNKSHIYFTSMEEERKDGVLQERSMDISLKDLSKQLEDFAKVRNWEKYHSPRNLLLAMVINSFLVFYMIIFDWD